MTVSPPEPHTIPIPSRPPKTWAQFINAISFLIVFDFGSLMINSSQFVFLAPLLLLPFPWARELYEEGIRYTKGAFGSLLVLMSQWFAPTKLVVTFERTGKGRFSEDEIRNIVSRDKEGNVVALRLPDKSVLISNHQVYTDWWYLWCLTYVMNTHRDVFIILKKSLKWLPIVGWGMQFFNFIFLDRSWASDRLNLATQLSALGRHSEKHNKPLSLIIYPEGTLVSEMTRPISKKFADKMGIEDLAHILLPRSTGLFYSLRSLAPRVPTLRLIDVTMVYPGVPPKGYGQSYYTLRSIFCDRIPPPAIHIHLRIFDVASEVPIGSSKDSPIDSARSRRTQPDDIEFSEEERTRFDLWLRELWQDKDQLISRFHETGTFVSETTKFENSDVVIPMELRRKRDFLDAFCFCGPAIAGYIWAKFIPRHT